MTNMQKRTARSVYPYEYSKLFDLCSPLRLQAELDKNLAVNQVKFTTTTTIGKPETYSTTTPLGGILISRTSTHRTLQYQYDFGLQQSVPLKEIYNDAIKELPGEAFFPQVSRIIDLPITGEYAKLPSLDGMDNLHFVQEFRIGYSNMMSVKLGFPFDNHADILERELVLTKKIITNEQWKILEPHTRSVLLGQDFITTNKSSPDKIIKQGVATLFTPSSCLNFHDIFTKRSGNRFWTRIGKTGRIAGRVDGREVNFGCHQLEGGEIVAF